MGGTRQQIHFYNNLKKSIDMKTTLNFIVRSAAVAAALTLASAGASAGNLTTNGLFGTPVDTAAGGAFGDAGDFVSPGAWSVNFGGKDFLAFCIDPVVALNSVTNNYTASAYVASASEKRLFENYYAGLNVSLSNQLPAAAFQLALWELHNDDANLRTGALRFTSAQISGDPDVVGLANSMLLTSVEGNVLNKYQYTALRSDPQSQALLSVSAVPEASEWAMLVAGLGLIGFMRRRKAA